MTENQKTNTTQQNRRFVFIDALRGIASLGVVLFHTIEGNHVGSFPDLALSIGRLGKFGVPIFFVISGFVIAHSLRDGTMTPLRFFQFIAKRSVRLDPPYWIAIVTTIAFSMLAQRFVSSHRFEPISLGQILAHLTYTQDILGYSSINSVFWTLCYEVQFYIVYAALLFFGRKSIIVAAFVVSLAWCFRLAPELTGWFPQLWFAFLLGVAAWYGWTISFFLPISLAYLGLVGASAIWFTDSFALTACLTATAIFIVARAGKMETILRWRWLQFLGRISYSLYLIHNPITGAVFRISGSIFGSGLISDSVTCIASILICIACSFALWRLVEQPCMLLSKRLFSQTQNSNSYSREHLKA